MKLIYKYLLLICFGITLIPLKAQQNNLFNTYVFDLMQLNIAYSANDCMEANLNYRNQWIGTKETPKLYQLNAHMPLGNANGLGLRVASQQAGILNTTMASAGYGYSIRLNNDAKILFGLGIGFIQNTLNAQKATVIDLNDVTLQQSGKQRAMGFDSELGAMYIDKKIKAGISVQHLYTTPSDFAASIYKTLPLLNTSFSYLFNEGKRFEIEPLLVDRFTIKGTNVLEGIVNVHMNKQITAGLGYRSHYGLLAIVGVKIDRLKIAYSFDYGTSKNRTATGSSHQILLGYTYCQKRKPNSKFKTKIRQKF